MKHFQCEAARCRVCRRSRLPLRLHTCVVAALEGALRGGRRSRRHPVSGAGGRIALVADGSEPDLRRGRVVRPCPRRRRTTQGRLVSTPGRGQPGGRPGRADDARGHLAVGDAALAQASRRARSRRAPRCTRGLHGAHGPPHRHSVVPARALRPADRLLRRRRADEPARVRRHGHRLQLVPPGRPVRVRPRRVELRRRARTAARTGRATGRSGLLGRRPGFLRAARGREADGRVLLRLRRQVPARMDAGARRRTFAGAARMSTSRSAGATSRGTSGTPA